MADARSRYDGAEINMYALERPLAHEPLKDQDPFGIDERIVAEQSSRESLRSFWIGLAGMAVLLHVAIYLEMRTTNSIVEWLRGEAIKSPNPRAYYNIMSGIFELSARTLMPCIVLVTVVPLLYWRGGLVQRFVLSGVLVITAMNLSVTKWWGNTSSTELQGLLATIGCWTMFPFLFLYTPINTPRLRLVVASCMLILTVCVSVLHMNDLRGGVDVLYWECIFGSAFLYALLKRNWGRVAMLESDATVDQIERTSSRTLLELMAVSGLAFASVGYWAETSLTGMGIFFLQASALGVASVLVSLSCIKQLMNWRTRYLWFLVFSWIAMSIVFALNGLLLLSNDRGFSRRVWPPLLTTTVDNPIIVISLCASLWLVIYSVLLGSWLRWCGWRMKVMGAVRAATKI